MATSNMIKGIPKSFFFIAANAIGQQSSQAFGPVSVNEYNLTAKFTCASDAMAYAICKGIILVQPQGNNLVNIILRPYSQPIPGLNVKYFVYRGLKKADFFNGDQVLAASTATSDFINKINQSFTNFYTSRSEPIPTFLAKYIGYNPSQRDTLPLADFFFKESGYVQSGGEFTEDEGMAFELPLIQEGSSLGHFNVGTCGIDVVLDYGDYKLPEPNDEFRFDLAYARAASAKIDLTNISNSYEKKLLREQIYQFVDIAAFYGLHVDNGTVIVKGATQEQKKQGSAIYSDLLIDFYTKNKWYIYIQSDRTRSYNFYGNYDLETGSAHNLKTGETETTLTTTSYGTNGWPLIINDTLQTHEGAYNILYVQFTKTPDSNSAMFYGQLANVANAQHNNFCDAENLSLPDDPDGTVKDWTRPLQLLNPAIDDDGDKVNIASLSILIYQGKIYAFEGGQEIDESNETVTLYKTPNYFDDVFDGLAATSLFTVGSTPLYSVLTNQRVKLINQYYNQTHYGIAAVQSTRVTDAIVTDDPSMPLLKRVTYIAESIDTLNNAIAIGGRVNTGAPMSSSAMASAKNNNTYQLPEPFYYERQLFTDSTTTVTGLKLKTNNGALPDRIIVGMTEAEHLALVGLLTTNTLHNARLFLVDLFEDGNELISQEGTIYQKYRLGIVGEKANGGMELFEPEEEVIVYAIDRYYYYTEGYSRYVKEYVNNNLAIDLDIAL